MKNSQNKVFRQVLVKSAKSSTINFDPIFRGRNEVQKYKPTPYCLTEFHENNRFSHRELSFLAKMFFFKNGS